MRKLFAEEKLTPEVIYSIMQEEKPNQKEKVVLDNENVNKYIPKSKRGPDAKKYVIDALKHYNSYLERKRERNSR